MTSPRPAPARQQRQRLSQSGSQTLSHTHEAPSLRRPARKQIIFGIMGKGCVTASKYFLFLFNLIFFLLGLVILGFGLWLLLDNQSFIVVLSNSTSVKLACYTLIGVGGFSMLMGFLGCLGAIYEVRCLLGLLLFPCSCHNASLAAGNFSESGFCEAQTPDWPVYDVGCSSNVEKWLTANLGVVLGVCLGVALVELLGMVLSICLCKSVQREDYTKVPKY
ncbi:unnamed protein product [Menidia menidia]|uniref:(Atlantic silverside) hypothetical protein n=1 Tax=Menidia menidia TaxID=238744 RepID=A0A8S4A6W4_9TELE|nr:unnamed protein product [Menidia menidia]